MILFTTLYSMVVTPVTLLHRAFVWEGEVRCGGGWNLIVICQKSEMEEIIQVKAAK